MLTAPRHRKRLWPRGEDGFTFAELSVAMAAAIVVIIGLFSIMIVTLHQTQRTFTKVDSTRRARTALANIENELHSACLVGSPLSQQADPPVEAGSDATHLIFLSYYGKSASPTPTWHVLSFASGSLTDTTYAVAGASPTWTQGAQQTTTTLLTNVAQRTTSAGPVPVFQYYAYQSAGTDSAGDTYMIVPDGTNLAPGATGTPPNTPLSTATPMSASAANSVVEVVINLLVGPSSERLNNPGLTGTYDPVTDSVSLRLTTPPDYVPAGASASGYGPCQ